MIRLTVRCRSEDAERVLADLLALVPAGVEQEEGDGWVEYSIYGPPGELPDMPRLEADEGLLEINSTEIPDDWADAWRDFHRPVVIRDGRMVIRPSWEERHPADHPDGSGPIRASSDHRSPSAHSEQAAGLDVVIDPGQAFGTGAHATTSLCLELLLELADAGEARGPLADLGTGSGVLAIAAAKLGWSPVFGCDSELAALEAAAENARVNGVELELTRTNLRVEAPTRSPTMVANLTAPLLAEVAERLSEPPAVLVCSGLLAAEADEVSARFRRRGLEVAAQRVSGDWAGILLRAA